jgi:transcriptional antiterminator RfaH
VRLSEIQVIHRSAWYCVRTQPKHEHIAAATITRTLGLEVFHPRLRSERASRRGILRVVEPLFPCYLFVHCCLGERLDDIRYVNGVSSLVHFGNKIPMVPELVIDELRQCFDAEEPMSVGDHLYPGAEVIVAEGAFIGFSGMVVRLLPAKQRVQILLEFLGRTMVAEVERKSLTTENRSVAALVPALATCSPLRLAVA